MAEVGNPNDGQQQEQTPAAPTAEEIKNKRRELLDKFEVESARSQQQTPNTETEDADDDVLDLSGVDPETAKKIKRQIQLAEKKSKHVSTLAQYGIEQAQRVKALEIAAEFGLDKDETDKVQKALSASRTPDAVDLAARELVIKLREDGTVKLETKPQTKSETGSEGNPPPVDTGRGGGANKSAAFIDKVDEIDPYGDPDENQKKMDALKKEADAAQQRFMQRAASR